MSNNGKKSNYYLQFKIKDRWEDYGGFGAELRASGLKRHSPDFISKVVHRKVDLTIQEEEIWASALGADVQELELDGPRREGIDF